MKTRNRALGKRGEDIAARFLSRKGYRIATRNVRTFVGEIDIIAIKGSSIIFVEVKTRRSLMFGPPYLSVTKKKERKLIHCAMCYLKMKGLSEKPSQIDIVSIELDGSSGKINAIEHFENAVENKGD